MEPIQNFAQLTAHLKEQNRRKRIAVVCANDPNTEYAITRALEEGIAEFLMIGDSAILEKYPALKQYPDYVKTIHIEDSDEAAREAVRIVREGGADILMKGIINTDNQRERTASQRENPHTLGRDGDSDLPQTAVLLRCRSDSTSNVATTHRNDLVCHLHLPSFRH